MSNTLIICVLTIIFITYSEAIACFECSSVEDPRCAAPFNNTLLELLRDCNAKAGPSHLILYGKKQTVCKKKEEIVYNELVVTRSCAWLSAEEEVGACSKSTILPFKKVEFCETCNTDSCNSSPSTSAAVIITFLIPIFSYFILK